MNEDHGFQALRQLAPTANRPPASAWDAPTTSCAPSSSAAPFENRPKVEHFRTSKNKFGYTDLLTPEGLDTKARITARFIQRKRAEYDALKAELEQLTAEAEAEGLVERPAR